MAGGAAKRSSDDGVFADTTKKKKVLKEKRDSEVVSKDKTSNAVSNVDSRQKKAFLAYFGKKFEDSTNISNVVNNSKKVEVNHIRTSNESAENVIDDVQILLIKKKENTDEKRNDIQPAGFKSVKLNASLPFVSSFVEDSGYFPKITHANQLAPLSVSNLGLYLNEEILYCNNVKIPMLSCQTISTIPKQLVLEPYKMEINLPYMISSFKKSAPNFPVLDFQKHIVKKKALAKKSATEIECLWIDKYKPMSSKDVLGNSEIVKALKSWLDPNKKKSKESKKGQKYYDDDNFIFDSDCDSDSSQKSKHNLAILLGPSGCGKTSTLFAVANELNANVIELNASCNRNGKRIITDLMEATQSHAVEKKSILNMLKGKKKKPKNVKNKIELNEKMTIILIEDADIFFDNYDDGFLSAISTLATDSKRPLILTANDPFSNNLLKFYLSNEIIFNFIHPPREHLICYLQLLALYEGAIMSKDEVDTIVHPFKPDIRQSLLQLQYILNTGELNKETQNTLYKRNINSLWWNWPQVIGCNLIDNENSKHANINMLNISQSLDSMLTYNLIHSKTQSNDFLDPQPFWYYLAKRDSANLIETNHWSSNSVQLSTDITEWIYTHYDTKTNVEKLYPSSVKLSNRQRLWNISKNILEQIGLDYCNRKNETCFDYMAAIRFLGRNQQLGNLRNSKMFSYLKRINIDVSCEDTEYFCDLLRSSFNIDQSIEISDKF